MDNKLDSTFKILILVAVVFLSSCNAKKSEPEVTKYVAPTTSEGVMQENLDFVKQAEQKLKKDTSMLINDAVGLSMISTYVNYIRNFPDDKKNNPDFLYKAAEISMNLKQGANAIRYIDEIKNNYPEAKQVPYAMFMKGFVYQNVLNDKQKAKETFTSFVATYPKNELVPSAQQILESIDMTEADFLKKIKRK